jgi:hypothetical protein
MARKISFFRGSRFAVRGSRFAVRESERGWGHASCEKS